MALTPDGSRLYIAGRSSRTLYAVDAASLAVIGEIPLTIGGAINNTFVSITPDGKRAYVNYSSDERISVVDIDPDSISFHQEIAVIATTAGGSWIQTAVSSPGNLLFASGTGSDKLVVVDVNPESPTFHSQLAALSMPNDNGGPSGVVLDELSISAIATGQRFPVGSNVIITGDIKPAVAILKNAGGPTGRLSVVESPSAKSPHVFVNGRPVDVIDPTGRFFARVSISPGENIFEFTTTDEAFGQSATATVTIDGVQSDGVDVIFDLVSDVSGSLLGEYARTSLNEDTNVLYADLAIRNDGDYPADTPLLVGISNLSDPSVRVRDYDGQTPDGVPYFDLSDLVDDGTLDPDEMTDWRTVSFYNPERIQFTYDLVFLGRLNEAPAITTVPDVEAIAGRSYTYDVDATDPNNDPLTFSLLSGPEGATIDPASGQIDWQPTAADIGSQSVVVEASDGRGGTTQRRVHSLGHRPTAESPAGVYIGARGGRQCWAAIPIRW